MTCSAGGGVGGLLGTEVVTIVPFALFRISKHGVRFGDLGEALGGFGVLGIHVWVSGSGKGVELSEE
jgi:hypothetical protein